MCSHERSGASCRVFGNCHLPVCCKSIITKSEKYVALKLSSSVSKDKANKLRNQRKFECLCDLNLKNHMMKFNKKTQQTDVKKLRYATQNKRMLV
jgi:predicted transcriptional regulator